jgi:urease subunit alpha
VSEHIGSIEVGKLADLVLWTPAFFGVKPDLVIKLGSIVAAPMGDPNASIPTPQPVHYRPMFAALGRSLTQSRVTFVSQASLEAGIADSYGLDSLVLPVRNTRNIGKKDMVLNNLKPKIDVHPETYEVRADGELLTCEPADVLPMAQRYFLY